MLKNDWLNLPEDVRDFLGDEAEDAVDKIVEKFKLDDSQRLFVFDLLDPIFLKMVNPLDLPNKMSKIPGADNLDTRLISLDFAYDVLWPMSEYLEKIDRLILRLGGKVPKKEVKSIKIDQNFIPQYFRGTVKYLIDKYIEFSDLRVTAKKITNKEGRLVQASVDNWIKDYIHFLGAGRHDSLQRSKYLSKSKNALELSKEERQNIRYLFLSYDDDVEFDFDKSDSILKIKEIEEEKEEVVQKKKDIKSSVQDIKKGISDLEEKIIPSDFLWSEADNKIENIIGIFWDSIGLMDKEKALGCLKVLIERRYFDKAIKEDKRLRGILKRYINIKYGKKFDSFIDKNQDKLLSRRLFLEMLLAEKLEFKEEEATLIAFYLTNLISGSGQVVYLDKNDSKLKWREINALGENITWVENLN